MTDPNILAPSWRPPAFDNPDIPNVARIYDHFLGGSINTQADRAKAQEILRAMPEAAECARTNRTFAAAAVAAAIAEHGIRQFIDLGAGLPTAGGLHMIAQHHDPTIRWVAVDSELVATHYGELVTQDDPNVWYAHADFTAPRQVLSHHRVLATIDFTQPVCWLLCAALHLVDDSKDPARLVAAYRDATVAGSGLILSHGTLDDPDLPKMGTLPAQYQQTNQHYTPRSYEAVRRLAAGYKLVPPGITLTGQWRPERLHSTDRPPKSGAWCLLGIRQ